MRVNESILCMNSCLHFFETNCYVFMGTGISANEDFEAFMINKTIVMGSNITREASYIPFKLCSIYDVHTTGTNVGMGEYE